MIERWQKEYESFLAIMKERLGKDTEAFKDYCVNYARDFQKGLEIAQSGSKLEVTGEVISLREIGIDDISLCGQIECEPENSPFVANWPDGLRIGMLANPDIMQMVIVHNEKGPIGLVILKNLMKKEQQVELKRIALRTSEKGKGYGREAIRLVQQLAFDVFHTSELYLSTKAENTRAQEIYKKAGFEPQMPDPCTVFRMK